MFRPVILCEQLSAVLIPHAGIYKNVNRVKNYKGFVGCVAVDSGLVVVRRKGKVFISGNSPFTNFQLDVTVPKRLQGRHPVNKVRAEIIKNFIENMR